MLGEFVLWLVVGWVLAAALMMAMYWWQLRTGDAGIVDVAWTAGVGGLGLGACWVSPGLPTRRLLIAAVVGVWALRLALYILQRVLTMPEDGRYQTMKARWGADAQRRMFWFYQFQAIACILFAGLIMLAAFNPAPLSLWDYLGVAVGYVAIAGESLADRQLHRFRQDPSRRGQVCELGLWRYSRHPNYFFEWLHWWSYVFLGITYSGGWFTLLGPLIMWYVITRVTGIPPTEAQALKSRGAAYARYQQTTNAFFPGPRRPVSQP